MIDWEKPYKTVSDVTKGKFLVQGGKEYTVRGNERGVEPKPVNPAPNFLTPEPDPNVTVIGKVEEPVNDSPPPADDEGTAYKDMHWTQLRKLMTEKNQPWTNTEDAVKYLSAQ